MNDLTGLAIALAAIIVSFPFLPTAEPKGNDPWLTYAQVKDRLKLLRGPYTFGWQRAPVLGAFFNGTFLFALGVSIFFQSTERLIEVQAVKNAQLVLITRYIGLALNIISVVVLHG